jgi:hypothetical protein
MYLKIIQYFAVVLALAFIYHNNPCFSGKNEFMFIALGLLIYHFFTNICSKEHYDAYDDGECDSELDEDGVSRKKCSGTRHKSLKISKLSKLEILNHVNNIIKTIGNEKGLNAIVNAINMETNSQKKKELMVLFEMTVANPKSTTKLVSKSPQQALKKALLSTKNPEYVTDSDDSDNSDDDSDNSDDDSDSNNSDSDDSNINTPMPEPIRKKFVKNSAQRIEKKKDLKKNKIIAKAKSDLIKLNLKKEQVMVDKVNKSDDTQMNKVMEKLAQLEATMQKKNTNAIPEFLSKMMAQNKYIDRNGLIRNAMNGDMKYSQLDPSQHQAPIHPAEDDKWDYAGYSILPPHVWRPRAQSDARDQFQEGNCPVCPMMTSGNTTDLAEWDNSRYVIGSDDINIDYIKELNRRKI